MFLVLALLTFVIVIWYADRRRPIPGVSFGNDVLNRVPATPNIILRFLRDPRFTASLIGPTQYEDWKFERILNTGLHQNSLLLSYATCVNRGCFIVFDARLTMPNSVVGGEPVRRTPMRLAEMVVQGWLAAGGTPQNRKDHPPPPRTHYLFERGVPEIHGPLKSVE